MPPGASARESPGRTPSERRRRAFRFADEFTVETFKAARVLRGAEGQELAVELRRSSSRCGGALVAASSALPGGENERRYLETARDRLLEARYYLYLARRLGQLELRAYRQLTARQDAALREMELLLEPCRPGGP